MVEMEGLRFSDEALIGMIAEGALMILIPVILLIVWKIRSREKVMVPALIGAAVWLLFAIVLKAVPAYFLYQADNPVAKAISGNIRLACLVAGILAGVFEETGRFLAFRLVLKKRENRRTAISYGIGHGGFESIYIGLQMISLAALGVLLSTGMADQITAGADEATKALLVTQLEPYTKLTAAECMLGVFERIPAIVVHLSLSVLVFAAVREKRYRGLYPLAIVLHAAMDFSVVFYQAGILPVWGEEILLAVFAAATAVFAARIYRRLRSDSAE
jgi:uncharacterized membrane protein YhfC